MEDPRNVIDYFKYWKQEAIVAALYKDRAPFAVTMEHWHRDLNIGGVIRNANAFNAREVHYVGRRQWDRRGAVGMHHYSTVIHSKTIDEWVGRIKGQYSQIIAFDNIDGAEPLGSVELPEDCMLVFGEESCGITDEMLELCDRLVYIEQYGAVRSLNASVASGVAMYEWSRQHR